MKRQVGIVLLVSVSLMLCAAAGGGGPEVGFDRLTDGVQLSGTQLVRITASD